MGTYTDMEQSSSQQGDAEGYGRTDDKGGDEGGGLAVNGRRGSWGLSKKAWRWLGLSGEERVSDRTTH